MNSKLIVKAIFSTPKILELTLGWRLRSAPAADPLIRMKTTKAPMLELTCQMHRMLEPINPIARTKVVTGPTLESASSPKRTLPRALARLFPKERIQKLVRHLPILIKSC